MKKMCQAAGRKASRSSRAPLAPIMPTIASIASLVLANWASEADGVLVGRSMTFVAATLARTPCKTVSTEPEDAACGGCSSGTAMACQVESAARQGFATDARSGRFLKMLLTASSAILSCNARAVSGSCEGIR